MIAYFSIGNSDDKLTQAEWSEFCRAASKIASRYAVHGVWFSLPSMEWQNACWCVEFEGSSKVSNIGLKEQFEDSLSELAERFDQDSIAVVYAEETVFVQREQRI